MSFNEGVYLLTDILFVCMLYLVQRWMRAIVQGYQAIIERQSTYIRKLEDTFLFKDQQ